MAVQYPGGQQVIIQYPMLLLQIGSPPLAVNADVTFLFGRYSNIEQAIVALPCVSAAQLLK